MLRRSCFLVATNSSYVPLSKDLDDVEKCRLRVRIVDEVVVVRHQQHRTVDRAKRCSER